MAPRTFQSREALAQHLANDEGFLNLPESERDAIFQQGLTQVQEVSSTLSTPAQLTLQDVFPATVEGLQQIRQQPATAFLPGGIVPRFALDALRAAGAVPGAAVNIAEDLAQGRGFRPGQAYTESFRGGRIDPTQEQAAMRQLTETALSAVPIGRLAAPAVNRLGQMVEQLPSIRLPRFRPRTMTIQDVLAVPEARLPKLTKAQRSEYFRVRAQQIKFQHQAIKLRLQQERVRVQKELGKAATQRSLELREKVPSYLHAESRHYRQLVDEELAPLANETVETRELAEFVKQRYPHPGQVEELTEVSARLGLSNESLTQKQLSPLVDELGRPIQQEFPTTQKLGALYEQAKEFGQELPRVVRESLRTYNRTEHFTDNAIQTLYSFLKATGINLTAANEHWSVWARIRNQLVSEARPYNLAGTQTASFSRRLLLQAKGIDPDNVNYATTIAKGLFGEQSTINALTGPIKGLVARLNSTEKQLAALRLIDPPALEALKQLKFQVGQLAANDPRRGLHILGFIRRWILPGVFGGRPY